MLASWTLQLTMAPVRVSSTFFKTQVYSNLVSSPYGWASSPCSLPKGQVRGTERRHELKSRAVGVGIFQRAGTAAGIANVDPVD